MITKCQYCDEEITEEEIYKHLKDEHCDEVFDDEMTHTHAKDFLYERDD